jgi:hypothetical protein
MDVRELERTMDGDLVIAAETLNEAGLTQHVRVLVQQGEIRILPDARVKAAATLDELAGALGQEAATSYDFDLKVGSWYEAR